MTASDTPSIAMDDTGDPPLRPLPERAASLLARVDAPPRLVAHLRAVHDVAAQLVAWVQRHCPRLESDAEAVLFGAATHDIGKALHPAELSGPGARHEAAGRELLLTHGVEARLARFAGTHASWTAPGIGVEDLLVSLADKVWKNKRVPELEDLVVARLAGADGRPAWQWFMELDETLTAIGEGADRRLAYQMSHPLTRPQ
ncbi:MULTISPECIES: HD domain-containing protein [Streptomyces]|uniref:HD domain-containing protein n=1 Tax=Streptomyces tricolor TaxID=68277 RepID=A0ABS9JHU9_9ACTN|nr:MULTISPECIES: HD domain-containing protein [Streptomyces]MCE0446562.1 HD domain-containing protein [Streptomyces tricolor]MCG0065123.1 HD domain-containing protein [Streptomyces tricolor]MYU26717.1 HD domain-containing protein [Streptomyces sp. SID7810]